MVLGAHADGVTVRSTCWGLAVETKGQQHGVGAHELSCAGR